MRLYTLTKKFRIRFKGRRDPLLSYAPFQRFPPSFTRVEQRARWPTNLEERGRGEDRRRQRIVKRLKLLWSGGRGKGGFFCPEDLLVIKPNGRRNSPAISHRPAVEGKRGGLIPESTASGSKRSGTSSFPAKLDLVSRSSNASIPSFPFPSPPLLSSPSPFPRNKPSSLPRFRGD